MLIRYIVNCAHCNLHPRVPVQYTAALLHVPNSDAQYQSRLFSRIWRPSRKCYSYTGPMISISSQLLVGKARLCRHSNVSQLSQKQLATDNSTMKRVRAR